MEEKILAKNPDPAKQGVRISREKYEAVREAILDALRSHQGGMTFQALRDAVQAKLEGNFEGSISWYYTTVKLDLEARDVIERVDQSSPQRLRMREESSGA